MSESGVLLDRASDPRIARLILHRPPRLNTFAAELVGLPQRAVRARPGASPLPARGPPGASRSLSRAPAAHSTPLPRAGMARARAHCSLCPGSGRFFPLFPAAPHPTQMPARCRDNFERADLGQTRQDFILDSFGEVSILLVAT